SNKTTLAGMAEAEERPGFTFAIMVDKGAIKLSSCRGCTPQQALIEQVQYVEHTLVPSPAYMRINGRPVITNFDIDLHYTIDWNAVNAATSTHPDFLFQHSGGFTHSVSGGSYSWVIVNVSDFGMSYLTKFYKTGLTLPQKETIGAAYKGFNDTLASWGQNRIVTQRCGHTWLQTFKEINSFYNSTNQLDSLQLVTWNDYEEGTEIETGIDNCFAMSAGIPASSLVTITPVSGSFHNSVALSCSNLPAGAVCSFSPSTITPGTQAVTSTLTISAGAAPLPFHDRDSGGRGYGLLLSGFGI